MQDSQNVFRIGRKPDPWSLLSWTWAHDDGTFGNRYDDPQAKYRVIYAATERYGCFVETLARYRVDPLVAAGLAAIEGKDDFYPVGKVPPEWLVYRTIGNAIVQAKCADIYESAWVDKLRIRLLPHLATHGLTDLDAAALYSSSRQFTQLVSRVVYELGMKGIKYPSKFGHDIENWAFFEPVTIDSKSTEILKSDDPDLLRALTLHHLEIGS